MLLGAVAAISWLARARGAPYDVESLEEAAQPG